MFKPPICEYSRGHRKSGRLGTTAHPPAHLANDPVQVGVPPLETSPRCVTALLQPFCKHERSRDARPHSPAAHILATLRSLVSRGTCVLAEFTTTSGNFTTVTRSILAKLPLQDTRMSYVYDK